MIYRSLRNIYKAIRRKYNNYKLKTKFNLVVFNHIPKCGGTSIQNFMNQFYVIKRCKIALHAIELDAPLDKKLFDIELKLDIKNLIGKQNLFICGHFPNFISFFYDIYPEIDFNNGNVLKITILRDPYEAAISRYYHIQRINQYNTTSDLQSYLETESNYFSVFLECTEQNYKQILDSYHLIGLAENMDKTISMLNCLLGTNSNFTPHSNKRPNQKKIELSEDVYLKFRSNNQLDYLIYSYAQYKFHRLTQK